MTLKLLLTALILLCGGSRSYAQEKKAPALFPLVHAAAEKEFLWCPSWPAELPPDAFRVAGRAASVRVEGDDWSYQLSRDRSGRIVELPVIGNESSVSYSRGPDGMVKNIIPAEGGVFRVIEAEDGIPRLLAGDDGTWVRIGRIEDGWSEAHYDGDGAISAFHVYAMQGGFLSGAALLDADGTVAESLVLQRNSAGLVSAHESGDLRLSALYDARGLPVRFESQGNDLARTYQWDERGLLVRMRRIGPGGTAEELRYEYRFDLAGNWIERWEIPLITLHGVLVPQTPFIINRKIRYF